MPGSDRVGEERQGFEDEPLVGLYEIPDDELTEADLEAIRDLEEGRFVSHEAVVRWLESWGTDHELPPPKCGD